MAIQNRGGNFADFDPFKMLPREFAYLLDTEELYYCVAPGNVKRVATKEDIVQILDTNQEAYDGLQQLLIELENETVASGILNDISDLLTKTVQHDGKIDSLENSVDRNTNNIDDIKNNYLAYSTPVNLSLQNGWTGNLSIKKNGLGQVTIFGEITPGTTTVGTTIASIPDDCRPPYVTAIYAQSLNINLGGVTGFAITVGGFLNLYATSGDLGSNPVRINYTYQT